MAQILQSISSIEIFMADLIASLTGMDSDSVLIQYQQEGQPAVSINDDVAYVVVKTDPDERATQKNRRKTYNENNHTYTFSQQSYRTLSVNIIFYGPNCFENAALLNEKIYTQTAQLLLKQSYLSLVSEKINGPIRINEKRNGQWFNRCDLSIGLYNTIQIEEVVDTFTTIPVETEVS